MTTRNPDQMVPLGTLSDPDFGDVEVHRDYDTIVLPRVQLDLAGIKSLRGLLDKAVNGIAAYRLRELDFAALGIDLDDARADLSFYPGLADESEPGNLELADWNEVGRRMEAMRPYGGNAELRKLHALLTADEVPATEAAS